VPRPRYTGLLQLKPIVTYGCLHFLFSPVDCVLRLSLFAVPVMSPDYLFYLVKMVTETLSHCFAIRWAFLTDYTPLFAIRSGNLTTQSPLLLVPEWPFRKYHQSQRHTVGAFVPLIMSFLPSYLQPQWLPGGIACVRVIPVVWACLLSPDSRYLSWRLTVFPTMVVHSTQYVFVVLFPLIHNFLIHTPVDFCPHRVFNLPVWLN